MNNNINAQLIANAATYYGLEEKHGPDSEQVILDIIHRIFPGWRDDSSIAWCSLFMIEIAQNVGAEDTTHLKHPGLARGWLKVGQEIELEKLKFGDVVILTRGNPNNGKGHVGFFVNMLDDRIYLLGGNQSNRVCVDDYDINRFLGGRRLRLKNKPENITIEEDVQKEEIKTQPDPQTKETNEENQAINSNPSKGGCLNTMKAILLIIISLLAFGLKAQNTCYTSPVAPKLTASLLAEADPNIDYCASVKIEVAHDIYLDKGANTLSWVSDLLNQVSLIYEADGVQIDWNIFIWETPDPYQGNNTLQLLQSFQNNHLPFSEDVAQLISYRSSGGIAYVDVICHNNFGLAYSAINPNYNLYPDYSWSVMVIAHELGHNLGSPHTHACAWNGNSTAIDGCAGGTEGNCPNPGSPAAGGTVMSYCHFTTGIDFTQGFHPQVVNLMKNRIAGANCTDCDNPPPPPVNCNDNEVIVEVMPDAYPMEISYTLTNSEGEILAQAGPWDKYERWLIQTDSLCLPDGCYTFTIRDFDGLAGQPGGDGAFYVNNGDNTIASGIDFVDSVVVDFCLGDQPGNDFCEGFVFQDAISVPTQDFGTIEFFDNNQEIELDGNAWKAFVGDYEVTPNTVLEFDVKIEREGEIHGVGFWSELYPLEFSNTMRIAGTQFWGNGDYDDGFIADNFRHYEIPIGQIYQQANLLDNYPYLVIVNDMDQGLRNPLATWKNLTICEVNDDEIPANQESETEQSLYPNPAKDTVFLPTETGYLIVPANGSQGLSGYGSEIDISNLPPGVYAVLYQGKVEKLIVL